MVLWLLVLALFQIKIDNKPTDFKTIMIEGSKKSKFNVLSQVELSLHMFPVNVQLRVLTNELELSMTSDIIFQLDVDISFGPENFGNLIPFHCP